MRTFTDEDGRYRFQSVPGPYEVYASGGFGSRVAVDVPGGKSVVVVNFSPTTNWEGELADPGRMRRQLKENPHIVDEPVLDYGSLLLSSPRPTRDTSKPWTCCSNTAPMPMPQIIQGAPYSSD
jgi:hypothetical protein